MSTPIQVPQMGESVTEGIVARWLKDVGEHVDVDEPVVEIETDKVSVEVPAPVAGVLTERTVAEGDTVAVGQTIGTIDETAKAAPSPAGDADRGTSSERAAPAPTAPEPSQQAPSAAAPAPTFPAPVMPAARAEAQRRGVDPSAVPGTGRGGRVLKEDVVRHATAAQASAAPAPRASAPASTPPRPEGREERKRMTPLRKTIARRLVEAQQHAALLTTFNEVDMSAVIAVRKRHKEAFIERHGAKLGFMSFFVKAAVEALKAFPAVNSEIDGEEIVYKYHYDIGVAVGGGRGLVVPVIRNADALSFAEIEKTIADFARRARENKLSLDELQGGTFTISNGGVYGSMLSTPIINPPQTGILGLHNIVERPMAVDGKVEIRPVMYVALTYDHRVIDGREAVQFLVRIKECIEDPTRLLLEV
ncbi:MAG: 2-oxoglutarate dehydrogenase complex dihydrolipoyllysine-residue succinyltransferase [Deltaproteobacteria bacterium]|nr:MAG: 2-oxoglutarate dehydrogenase complex dihydrolipoyllysine-residue succinyltransferase [Deltaproteobacteria bacterium]